MASHNVVLRGLAGLKEAALNASFTATHAFMERQARARAVPGRVLEATRVRDTAGASTMRRRSKLAAEDLHLRESAVDDLCELGTANLRAWHREVSWSDIVTAGTRAHA